MGLYKEVIHKYLQIFGYLFLVKLTSQTTTMSGKGSGLTKPMKLSAELAEIVGMKEASRAHASRICGSTSRNRTSKIQKTSNTFSQTKRWPRFSVLNVAVHLEWPNSWEPIYLPSKWYGRLNSTKY